LFAQLEFDSTKTRNKKKIKQEEPKEICVCEPPGDELLTGANAEEKFLILFIEKFVLLFIC